MPNFPINPLCVSVIFNPASGKGNPDQRQKEISEALSLHGYSCQFFATTKTRGAMEVAKEELAKGIDKLLVSGGDGTVMEVLAAAVGSDVPVGVLPAGTGNLLSINLGIPTTLSEAVEIALTGTPQRIDLARTETGRYFAIMGGIGMDAHLIHDADRTTKDRLGVFAYFLAAFKHLGRARIWVSISLDGQPPIRRKVKMLLIANMGKITGGLQAVPTADPANGSLEVSVVRVRNGWEWLRILYLALRGRTNDDPRVEIHTARQVTVQCDRPERVQFDGEDGGMIKELIVEARHQAVFIILPKQNE